MSTPSIFSRLNAFLASDHHCLLLSGPWGCGKTYLIDHWVEQRQKDQLAENLLRPDKYIRISLFGKPDINSIYCDALSQIFTSRKLFKRMHNFGESSFGIGLGPVSLNAPLSLIAAGMENDFPPILKHHRSIIIIIDDIERASPNVSFEDFLGFVEVLPSYIKVILIANKEELGERGTVFSRYSERVIDEVIAISEPTKEVLSLMLGDRLYQIAKNHSRVLRNLRTVVHFKAFAAFLKPSLPDEAFLYAFYVITLYYEGELGNDHYLNFLQNELSRPANKYAEESLKKLIDEARKTQFDNYSIANKIILRLHSFHEIEEWTLEFAKQIIHALDTEDYTRIKEFNIPARNMGKAFDYDFVEVVLSAPNLLVGYLDAFQQFSEALSSASFNIFSICKSYSLFRTYFFKMLPVKKQAEVQNLTESFETALVTKAAETVLVFNYLPMFLQFGQDSLTQNIFRKIDCLGKEKIKESLAKTEMDIASILNVVKLIKQCPGKPGDDIDELYLLIGQELVKRYSSDPRKYLDSVRLLANNMDGDSRYQKSYKFINNLEDKRIAFIFDLTP